MIFIILIVKILMFLTVKVSTLTRGNVKLTGKIGLQPFSGIRSRMRFPLRSHNIASASVVKHSSSDQSWYAAYVHSACVYPHTPPKPPCGVWTCCSR